MSIPEFQLITWSSQCSVIQSSNTYNTTKRALESSNAPYADKDFTVFLQGSYGNDTNIYAESDVDIVIQLRSCFSYNIDLLPHMQQTSFRQTYNRVPAYTLTDFKRDVVSYLIKIYGNAVVLGDKAIKINGNGTRRDVDIIVSMGYRKYQKFESKYNEYYIDGICFLNSSNAFVNNYPKAHLQNCTAKHQKTSGWYKPTVRIFKNFRNKLIQEGVIGLGDAPSYFLEGLLYNVPDVNFGGSYADTVFNAISWFEFADQDHLLCANEQYYLLNNASSVTWRADKYAAFRRAAYDYWSKSK